MPTVWADAREAVARSDRLVFFGYSLPPADIEAEMLFRRALANNTSLGWVDVINKDASAAGRFASLSPDRPLHWYGSVESFLARRQAA